MAINVAVFASGNGSNFKCLVDAMNNNEIPINIRVLVCNNKDAYAIERAVTFGIEVFLIDYKEASISDIELRLIERFTKLDISYLLLAGFMKILSPIIINEYPNKIINIHPSLLPKYPGLNAVEQALTNNEEELGITIHYVDELVDHGNIIKQESFNIKGLSNQDIYKTLHVKEHILYIEALKEVFMNRGEII